MPGRSAPASFRRKIACRVRALQRAILGHGEDHETQPRGTTSNDNTWACERPVLIAAVQLQQSAKTGPENQTQVRPRKVLTCGFSSGP